MAITLYNTLTRKIETFVPMTEKALGMYHCGPTVYDYAHIGNLRAYIFADTLRRMFEASGYAVTQVINITDVGHLVSDADEGEDKIEKGAKREGTSVDDIIARYTHAFTEDLESLNILPAHHIPAATKHIAEQIAMIKILEDKGHTYRISDGIYFDTSTFPAYGDFARLDLTNQVGGARIGEHGEKKNPQDFALWKFSQGEKRLQEWDSPWGVGFPGWHIECSAMSQKYLGTTFDIHTGGIDHIPVHHTNEIAQSECANGKPLANYWMHSGFMTVEGEKMSKSIGNTYRLSDLAAKGVSPAALRYWFLSAKYDTTLNFTWDALLGAEKALQRFAQKLVDVTLGRPHKELLASAVTLLQNNLDTPSVIAMLHTQDGDKPYQLLKLLGIDLDAHIAAIKERLNTPIPADIIALGKDRDAAKAAKDYAKADMLRKEIESRGFTITDTKDGAQITLRDPA